MHFLEHAIFALSQAEVETEEQKNNLKEALIFLASHSHSYFPSSDGLERNFVDQYPSNDCARFIDELRENL